MIWKFPTYEIDQPLNWDLLASKFSWIEDMKSVMQDSIWHGEGNVFTHTKMVVESLINLPEFQELDEQNKHILVASAIFHDVEKRSTTAEEEIDGIVRIVSPRHAKKGEFTTRTILYKDIKTPFLIREQIAKLVRWHGLPLWAITKSNPQKEVIKASLILNTQHVSMLAKADVLGRISNTQEELLLQIELFNTLCEENNSWGKKRYFLNDLSRFTYLNSSQSSPDYEPYDNSKFEVTVLAALAGSGKDTHAAKLDLPILSLDNIRREYKIDPTDKKKNGLVIQMGKEKAKEFMRKKTPFVFNATNLTKDRRGKWISLFLEYGARIKIIYIEVPYKQLLSQNHNREYKVPEKVIEKMITSLEIPGPEEAHELVFKVTS